MLNLNPELVNQDKIRKARRKRMLKIAALPCLALFLCSLFIFRIGVFNIVYGVSYDNQNYDVANSMTDFQGLGNIIMPYLKYYDGGVAKLNNQDYEGAEDDFRSSLKENPPADVLCKVYVNLSLSIEFQADEKYRAESYEDALVLYTKARSTLYSNGCVDKSTDDKKDDSKDAKAKEAAKRIDRKASTTMKKMNDMDDDGDNPSGSGQDITMSEEQKKSLQNLKERQAEALWNIQSRVRGGSGYGTCTSSENKICW